MRSKLLKVFAGVVVFLLLLVHLSKQKLLSILRIKKLLFSKKRDERVIRLKMDIDNK